VTQSRFTGVALAVLVSAVTLCACGGASRASFGGEAAVSVAAANPVTVSPQPGTSDASAVTQISFLGPRGTSVGEVRVVGSRSGLHRGVLRRYSTDTGESFLPARPFVSGERVSVRARVDAGRGSREASTTFRIARQVAVSQNGFPITRGDPKAVQHYSSAPELTPSTVRVITPPQPGATPGDLFLAPYQGQGSPGPMIVDQAGNLVWFHPLPKGIEAANFGVQSYEGKPVLGWWQGRILQLGFGEGEDVLYDTSYRPVAAVRAGNGYRTDLHEFRLTPQGTAWIESFDPIRVNPRSGHGAAATITDSVIQEIDVKTGLVMWEWHALAHIPVLESNNPSPGGDYPWDYIHINSIDPGPRDDVLLSARNSWALYDVNIHSGAIAWRLGGRHSSFKLPAAARFYWQHDAEFQPGGLISIFDNGSNPPKEKQSRGLLLRPDLGRRTVSLVSQFVNPTKTLLAESQGNALGLPGGNWLLGYGRLPNLTEYDAAGHVLLDATLGAGVQSFKALLAQWSGQPATAPSVAASSSQPGQVSVAASWNGATTVASWRVLAGSSPSTLTPVASAPKRGFETTIAAPADGPYFAAQALDSSGAVIGVSAPTKL
jgi:hypothetical protein